MKTDDTKEFPFILFNCLKISDVIEKIIPIGATGVEKVSVSDGGRSIW